MIFVTGDCHGDFRKFSTESFPEQKEMTKDDIVIICGDFGAIWDCDGISRFESYWLNWLDEKPFTTVFVDGNHENFDRLTSEFEIVDFHGGKAHKLNNSVYHLCEAKFLVLKESVSLLSEVRDHTTPMTEFSRGKILTLWRNSRKLYAFGKSSERYFV